MDLLTYIYFSDPVDENCPAYHSEVPSHNLLSFESFSEVSKIFEGTLSDCSPELDHGFPFYQPFPYVVQNSILFSGSCHTDHAYKLVERKLAWERELEELKVSNINAVVKNIKKIRQNEDTKLSKSLKKYIKHFHLDPEPMFSGNYNWLYTGGCLCVDEESDGTYLISSDITDNKSTLRFMQLNKTQDKIVQNSSFQLNIYSPVLQINCRPHTENLIICVRQKHHLSLFEANRMNLLSQPVRLLRKKVSGSKLLTCVDLEVNCEKFIVSDSNYDINIFHVERKNKIYGYPGRKIASDFTKNTWSQIEFGDHGVYWALRNRFVILDPKDFNLAAKLNFELPSEMDPCENISSFSKSPSDANFIYLSTTHKVLQLDLRNRKIVQRWTHLMEYPPQFMATVKDKEKSEVLLLQSSLMDEILGLANEHVKKNGEVYFLSKSLPYLLKNIKHSVSSARDRNRCFSFLVTNKIDFSVTGLQCLKNNQGDVNVFITNSGGDIFLTKIRSGLSSENEEEIIEGLEVYESALEKFRLEKSHKKLENFEFTDMSQLLQDFQHSEVVTAKKEEREIYWEYQKMNVYKVSDLVEDILAQGLLKVWFPPNLKNQQVDGEDETKILEDNIMDWLVTL